MYFMLPAAAYAVYSNKDKVSCHDTKQIKEKKGLI